MKTLHDKLKITKEQYDAIYALESAFDKCLELGLDFVFDQTINKLSVVNLKDAELNYAECTDPDVEQLPYPTNADEIDLMEECVCEIEYSYSYYHDEIDRLVFTNKQDTNN